MILVKVNIERNQKFIHIVINAHELYIITVIQERIECSWDMILFYIL